MGKKGVELSLNALIIAALALGVLVVLSILFTSEAGDFSRNVRSCEVKGGICVEKGKCQYQTTSWSCPKKEEPECCVNPLSR